MLLAAWNSADLLRIHNAIDQVRGVDAGSIVADEAERLELLQEIAGVIRQWMEGRKSAADLNACLKLLGHLVNSGATAAFREVPQLETRVYCPR
jgi:hypothetical protein